MIIIFVKYLITLLLSIGIIGWFIYLYFFNIGVYISRYAIENQMNKAVYGTTNFMFIVPVSIRKQVKEKIMNTTFSQTQEDNDIINNNNKIQHNAFIYTLILTSSCFGTALLMYLFVKFYYKTNVFETNQEIVVLIFKIVFVLLAYICVSYVFIRNYVPLNEKDFQNTLINCIKS